MIEPTVTTGVVTAVVYAALHAGHWLGDHPVQPNAAAAAKGHPTDDQLAAGAHPWTGWTSIGRHVFSYLLTQAVALLLVALVAPVTVAGAVTALAVSGSTHAVIDRRWIVRMIVRIKGCEAWTDGPYLIDQSLHQGALLPAAVLGALVTTTVGALAAVTGCVALVVAGMAAEQLRTKALTARPAPSDRL